MALLVAGKLTDTMTCAVGAQGDVGGNEDGGQLLAWVWRCLLTGIAVNALHCHVSPGLMVRLQSNPWTTQFHWLFGVKAQNFQALNFVLYHQSLAGKISHIPTLVADFFCWTYLIFYTLGPVISFLVLCLVVAQSMSARYTPLVIATAMSCVLAMTMSACATSLSADTESKVCQYAQVTIIMGGLARVIGHAFEAKQPPMPATTKDIKKWIRFVSTDSVPASKAAVVIPSAILAEISAGMPLRLYVPLLNTCLGNFIKDTGDTRPDGLQSVGELERVSKRVLAKGWKRAAPDVANMIYSATELETFFNQSPDFFLSNSWHYFFTVEGFLLFGLAVLWIVSPTTFVSGLGWSLNSSDKANVATSLAGPRSPTTFALCLAASFMACGCVWILFRMLSARNTDIRAFCYVIEGLTLCLFLQLAMTLDLQLTGLAPDRGYQREWKAPRTVYVYACSALLLTLAIVNCFFLASEIPRIRKKGSVDYGFRGRSTQSVSERRVSHKPHFSCNGTSLISTSWNKGRMTSSSRAASTEKDSLPIFMSLKSDVLVAEHIMQDCMATKLSQFKEWRKTGVRRRLVG